MRKVWSICDECGKFDPPVISTVNIIIVRPMWEVWSNCKKYWKFHRSATNAEHLKFQWKCRMFDVLVTQMESLIHLLYIWNVQHVKHTCRTYNICVALVWSVQYLCDTHVWSVQYLCATSEKNNVCYTSLLVKQTGQVLFLETLGQFMNVCFHFKTHLQNKAPAHTCKH